MGFPQLLIHKPAHSHGEQLSQAAPKEVPNSVLTLQLPFVPQTQSIALLGPEKSHRLKLPQELMTSEGMGGMKQGTRNIRGSRFM